VSVTSGTYFGHSTCADDIWLRGPVRRATPATAAPRPQPNSPTCWTMFAANPGRVLRPTHDRQWHSPSPARGRPTAWIATGFAVTNVLSKLRIFMSLP